MLLPSTSFSSRCRLVDEPHEISAQLVADALIMAMPRSGEAFAHCRSFEERDSRARYCRSPGVSSTLANAIVAPHNYDYLQIQYGIVGFQSQRLIELAHA